MDAFEQILGIFFEEKGYWVKKSVKVDLTKPEKAKLGSSTRPRAEIDLVVFDVKRDELILIEAKSYFDSAGVKIGDLNGSSKKNSKRYILLNNPTYQRIIRRHIKKDFLAMGLITSSTKIRLGLAAGKVQAKSKVAIKNYLKKKRYYFFSPDTISQTIRGFTNKGWDDSVVTVTAKIINGN